MDSKKYLDQEGVKFLWSKISMEDYPNNETLIAVLNAIDETKADKDKIPTKVSQLENDSKFVSEEQVEDLYSILETTYATKEYVQTYTKGLEATDEEIASLLLEADLLPVLLDDEGIITESDNTMILI